MRAVGSALFVCALTTGLCVVGCDTVGVGPLDGAWDPREAEFPLAAPPPTMQVPAPLPAAHCSVNVIGTGVIDLEEDYLPRVVTCENGGADLEALKAQAISARSVAYYNMETEGEICDSQGCQVYSCGNAPTALAIQAVQETSGLYLMYNSTLTYGFYVAGDNNTSGPSCVGSTGSTEHWITYNSGRSGTNVEQTELGFVHPVGDPSYGQNRGCMGQWGARCLEEGGATAMDILRFYYGEDIEVVQAEGSCVLPVDTTAGDDSAGSESGESSGSVDPSTSGGEPTAGDDTGVGGGTGGGEAGGGSGVGTSDGSGSDPTGAGGDESGGRDGEGALPGGFGEDTNDSACNCSSGGGGGLGGLGVLTVFLLGVRRRRAA